MDPDQPASRETRNVLCWFCHDAAHFFSIFSEKVIFVFVIFNVHRFQNMRTERVRYTCISLFYWNKTLILLHRRFDIYLQMYIIKYILQTIVFEINLNGNVSRVNVVFHITGFQM
jgi:hypothetical protein